MSRKKVTEEFLAKEVWWWREGAAKHPVDFDKTFAFPYSFPLPFNYELARRACRKRRLVSYTALNTVQLWIIAPFLGETSIPQIATRYAGNEQQESEKGWTQIHAKLQWNLNLSERILVNAFVDFIRQNRDTQGIPAPLPVRRKRRRSFSWRWLELMDMVYFKVRPLKSNERGSLSVAKKAAKQRLALFDKAIDEYWEMHKEKEAWEGPEDDWDEPAWLSMYKPVKTPIELWRNIWPLESVKR
jgi:hypothetical protein